MKLQDAERFGQLMLAAGETYNRVVSEAITVMWWKMLGQYDFEQVQQAFLKHFADPEAGQFFPKPADITRHLVGTRTDNAMVAWGKVQRTIREVGAYRDVVFDDALIHVVIDDLGGWPKVCRTTVEDMSYVQHRFSEAYRAYSAKKPAEFPALLSGESNALNRLNGKEVAPPVMIGNPRNSQLVLESGVGVGTPQLTQEAADLTRKVLSPIIHSALEACRQKLPVGSDIRRRRAAEEDVILAAQRKLFDEDAVFDQKT